MSNNNDNISGHSDSDHTQIFPMPGGNKEDMQKLLQNEQLIRQQSLQPNNISTENQWNTSHKESSTLVDAATPLLVLVAHISNTLEARDTSALKQQVSQEINQFIKKIKYLGVNESSIKEASYILCTAIDEAVLNTPWGRQSDWSINTLLSSYFQDVAGGQVFFEKLRHLGGDPVRNHQLLKLMYYCLALGYQGRYRTEPDAMGKLTSVRQWLVEKIRHSDADNTADLSPHWIGISGLGYGLKNFVSGWLISALAALLLASVFIYFFATLNAATTTVNERLDALKITTVERQKPKKIFTPPPLKMKTLQPIKGFVIKENSDSIDITIPGDILFSSGSTKVTHVLHSSLDVLATELKKRSGQVQITGHSDNDPLSLRLKQRYGSNQGLSLARAQSVATVLQQTLKDPTRISTYGKGSSAPISKNKSQNRRVEIKILY